MGFGNRAVLVKAGDLGTVPKAEKETKMGFRFEEKGKGKKATLDTWYLLKQSLLNLRALSPTPSCVVMPAFCALLSKAS